MIIKCEERYREALEYAKRTNDETLSRELENLKSWEKFLKGEITLYRDRALLSFYFEIMDEQGNRLMNGGLIYHGNPDQSHSYQITKTNGWQIHT